MHEQSGRINAAVMLPQCGTEMTSFLCQDEALVWVMSFCLLLLLLCFSQKRLFFSQNSKNLLLYCQQKCQDFLVTVTSDGRYLNFRFDTIAITFFVIDTDIGTLCDFFF